MQITIELPDDIAKQLTEQENDLPRQLLEALAIEGYRDERLSHGQVGRILNLDWWGVEALLCKAKAYLHYDIVDLERDRATSKKLKQLPTIAETFDEIRQICVEEDFELEIPPREDRHNPLMANDFSF